MKIKKMTNEERLEMKAAYHETDALAERANRFKAEFDRADASFKALVANTISKYEMPEGSTVDLATGEIKPPAVVTPPVQEVAAAVEAGAKRFGRPRKQKLEEIVMPPKLEVVPEPAPLEPEALAGPVAPGKH